MNRRVDFISKHGARDWVFFLVALSVLVPVWIRANPHLFISGRSYLSDWKYTHFLFNYEDGFVKRGLIGDVFSRYTDYTSYEVVNTFSYLSLLILAVAFFALASKPWRESNGSYGAFILMVVAVTSPATLQHFAFDVGRFDVTIYTMTIFLFFAAYLVVDKGNVVTLVMFIAITFASILIHEAAFFMVMPMALMFWHYVDSSRKATVFQVCFFLMVLLFTYLVATHGAYKALSLDAHFESIKNVYGERVAKSSLKVIHKNDLIGNIERTFSNGVSLSRLVHHAALVFFMFPFFYMLYKMYISLRRDLDLKAGLLILSSLSPLALYPLGHDHFRWWSLAITNLFIVIIILCIHNKAISGNVLSFFEDNKKLSSLVIVTGFVSGPLGITGSFDVVGYTARAIRFFL